MKVLGQKVQNAECDPVEKSMISLVDTPLACPKNGSDR
jgi:hypothetical protein